MKNKKRSAIEELRLERIRLTEECKISKERLHDNWTYAKSNFASLLASSIVSTAKSNINHLFGRKEKELKIKTHNETGSETESKTQQESNPLSTIFPIVWDIIQPILLGFAIKKSKSLFKRKKSKK